MDKDTFLKNTMDVLRRNPTAVDLDSLLSSYAILGNLAADAQALAEEAEMRRKYAQAEAFKRAKEIRSDKPLSDSSANNFALLETLVEQQEEIDARTKAKKITHLLEAVEQSIHAVKFLGRYDTTPTNAISLPGRK